MKKAIKKFAIIFLTMTTLVSVAIAIFSVYMTQKTIKNNAASTQLWSNLAILSHYEYTEQDKIIEGDIEDMSAMIYATRQVEASHKEQSSIADGKITLGVRLESLKLDLYAAQDYSLELDIDVDEKNKTINIKYPSDIFILSYNILEYEDSNNLTYDLQKVVQGCGNEWKRLLNMEVVEEDSSLMRLLESIQIHEGLEMEQFWQGKVKEEYPEYQVHFENTNPIVLTPEQEAELENIIIQDM